MRAWVARVDDTHYCLGSVMGPHPYPWMVRELQRVVGDEARGQCRAILGGADPDWVVACVGGGSNAAGTFAGFVDTDAVLVGVEAAGGAAVSHGVPGVVHGMLSYLLQDEVGQINEAHSISAGLDYPGARARARPSGRHRAGPLRGWPTTTRCSTPSGCCRRPKGSSRPSSRPMPSPGWPGRRGRRSRPGRRVLVTLSGRGDKDVAQVRELLA